MIVISKLYEAHYKIRRAPKRSMCILRFLCRPFMFTAHADNCLGISIFERVVRRIEANCRTKEEQLIRVSVGPTNCIIVLDQPPIPIPTYALSKPGPSRENRVSPLPRPQNTMFMSIVKGCVGACWNILQ